MSSIVEQVGRVIGGRYRLLAVVGAGASAQVFAADDARLSRRVAVKLLHPALAGDTTFLRKFQAEARLAASLNHRNVLHVYDWGDEDGVPYLVLEYLGGGSLRSLLDTGYRLSPSQAAAVGAEAANGLAYAHRRGLVHRDIKPANLLFDDDGRLLVADFGLARALAEAAITEPLGAVVGTARYASPEQVEGRPVDDRTDVYSLALTLYEAVTGRVPFAGETTVATLMARVGAVLPPARELGPLAPVLAQAAISEPLARLDAAGLAYELELLLLELDAPGPLPLAKAYVAVPSESRAFERDPTERFVLPAHEPSAAGLAEQSAPAEEPTPPAAPPASEIALAAVDPVESEPVRAWSIEAEDDLDDIDELIGFGLATEGQAPPAPSGPSAPAAVPSDVVEDSVDLVEVAGTAGIEQVSAPRTEQQPLPSASTPSPEDVGALSSPPAASSPTPSPSEPPGGASAGSLARDALTGDKAAGDKEPPSALPAPAPRAPEASTASVVNAPQKAPAPPEAESLPAPLRKGPVPAPAPVLSPLPGDPVSVPNGAPAAAAPRAEAARTQLASRPEDLAGVRRVITAPVPEPPPRRRKNRWLPWLLVVLLAEMGAGAGFLASRSHPVARDTVPFVTGLQYSSARATILRTGLYPELVGEQYSGSVPTGSVISQDPSRGVREKAGDIVRYVISQGRHPTAVPSLSGMSEEKATAALLGAHLVPRISELYSETVAAGTVLTWRSLAGRRVFYGDAVEVVLSKGPSPQTIPVDLAGGVRTWTQAESALTDLHLVAVENPRYSTTIPAGFVVTTQPAPGTTVPGHSRVLVLVSEGPPFETIPAILGGSVSAAEQALASLGLKWQLFGPAGASTVLTTLPRVGQSVRYGTTVSIYLY